MKKSLLRRIINFICVFAIVAQSLTPYLVLLPQKSYAQEATPTDPTPTIDQSTPPTDTATPTPTVDQTIPTDTVTPTPTDVPTDTVTPTPTEEVTPTNTQPVDNNSPPTPVSSDSSATLVQSQWQTNSDGSATTVNNVSLNQAYIAPQNDKVTVTFTKLPDNPGKLTITEVKLTADQQKASGAYSDTAYNITSDMKDGTFQYDLTLPLPDQAKGKSVEVKSSETADGLKNSSNVDQPKEVTNDTVTITGLNHFTFFIIVPVANLQPSYATPSGGGVYSAYYGPPAYLAVSPGSTAVYDGREAAPIYAGVNIDHTYLDYEDQGLFAFKPGDTPISTFATQPFTYDFENQYGANPVWVYIELNKGAAGDIIYQYVPTSNPSGWHTENARTGAHWQAWTDLYSGTPTGLMLSLADIAALDSSKTVSRVYLTEGIGNSYHDNPNGTVAWVDNVTIGANEYDFSTNVTTNNATDLTSNGATLNGTVGPYDVDNTSFWWGTTSAGPFTTAVDPSGQLPPGWSYHPTGTGAKLANVSFSYGLTGLTPATPYHFVAWSLVNGTWYPGEIKNFTTAGPVFIDTNVNGVWNSGEPSFNTIQAAISAATAGNTIHVTAGTYTEVGQIVINKNLSIVGDDRTTTIIKPNFDTSNSGDTKGWFLVNSGITFNLSKVTLDGSGHQIFQAIRDYGQGSIDNSTFENITFNVSGPDYAGTAIVAFGAPAMNVDVSNSSFTNIGRVGVLYYGSGVTNSTFNHNSYTGKSNGNWLDYAVEVGAGAHATITNNTVSNNTGVAVSDGSTSAGILVTTFFGAGTQATITGNTLTNNTDGIAVGYDASDTSVAVAHNNNLSGNIEHGVSSTAPTVDATNNWWGNSSGPKDTKSLPGSPNYNNPSGTGSPVTSYVNYEPWYTNSGMTASSSANPITTAATGVGLTDATLNGTNGNYDATNHTVWVSLNPFTAALPVPAGIYSTPSLGPISAGAAFTPTLLSSLTVNGVPSVLPPITPGTTYYYAVWSLVNGTWYPGDVKSFTTTEPAPTTVKVTIDKYVNGAQATADNTNSASFPMHAIYPGGEGNYDLNTTGFNNPDAYKATTSDMPLDSDYSTYETPASSCTAAYPFNLVGYSTGTTLANAATATVTTTVPSFTNLTSDKFIIVWNKTCPPVPVHLSPANNSTLTTAALDKIDWTDVTDPSLPITYIYQASNSSGTNLDGSFAAPVYTSGTLTNSEIPTAGTPEGVYYWHVRAVDNVGNQSAWSTPWKVTVDNTAPTTPGKIGWSTENPPVGSDYASGTDFDNYKTCGQNVNYSPMTNLWGPSTDTNGVTGYDREVYSPNATTLIYSSSLSTNYVNGGGAVNGTTYWTRVRAYDAAGNKSDWTTKCAITYDTTAPIITVDSLSTADHTPQLTGTVDDNSAIINITVDGITYTGTNNGNGTWTLADNTITTALSDGTYDIIASATDMAGNIGNDSTTNELTVNTTAAVFLAAATGGGGGDGLSDGLGSCPSCTQAPSGGGGAAGGGVLGLATGPTYQNVLGAQVEPGSETGINGDNGEVLGTESANPTFTPTVTEGQNPSKGFVGSFFTSRTTMLLVLLFIVGLLYYLYRRFRKKQKASN